MGRVRGKGRKREGGREGASGEGEETRDRGGRERKRKFTLYLSQ